MSKIILSIEEDYDFALLGISCHTKDYRLCWELNKVLNFDLVRAIDLEINKTTIDKYSFYEYIDEEHYLEYYLISNRSVTGYLIPEQKKVDFFFMIKGNISDYLIDDILSKTNAISSVLTSFKIDPNQLKSKQNLLF
jgi:hypothetical protein